jgi:hypothetical protein
MSARVKETFRAWYIDFHFSYTTRPQTVTHLRLVEVDNAL